MFEMVLRFLAEWSVRAAALTALAGVIVGCVRPKDANIRLAAWTAVFAGVVLIPIATMSMPGLAVTLPAVFWDPPPPVIADAGDGATSFDAFGVSSGAGPAPAWAAISVGIWLIVAMTMLIRLAAGLVYGARLVRASTPIDPGVRESKAVTVPVTIGILKPAILLPGDWRAWAPARLQAVLAHERSHVQRRDPLRQFATAVYRSVCWFHPLAWWLHGHLAELAEAASDDAALRAVGDPALYAETVFEFLNCAPSRIHWEGVAMARPASRKGAATKRVERILDRERALAGSLKLSAAAALIAVTIPVIYLAATMRPALAEQQTAVVQRPPVPGAPVLSQTAKPLLLAKPAGLLLAPAPQVITKYDQWLNDVSDIIQVQERAHFTALQSDPERDYFIEQFWDRRGAAFKKEHYRRLAYVKERFNQQGHQTDRGRTYMRYGPPDEIESHPGGSTPYESWLYHHCDLGDNIQMDFQVRTPGGEYVLQIVHGQTPTFNIDTSTPGLARITVPTLPGPKPVSMKGTVRGVTGKPVMEFEGDLGRSIAAELPLKPGGYILDVTFKDQSGRETRQAGPFTVK